MYGEGSKNRKAPPAFRKRGPSFCQPLGEHHDDSVRQIPPGGEQFQFPMTFSDFPDPLNDFSLFAHFGGHY